MNPSLFSIFDLNLLTLLPYFKFMKKHIETHLADIICKLPEKPFYIWILLIVVQAFQLVETGVCLMYRLNPHNQLYNALHRIIGLFTFRPIQEQFPIFCFFLQAVFIMFLVFISIKFIIGKPQGGPILNYCQVWCPVLITISIQSLDLSRHVGTSIIAYFTIVSSVLLWALRLMVLCQDYVSRNAKFSSIKSTIRMIVFTFQSIILYFPLTDTLVIVFIAVSSGLLFIAFILSLVIIENIDQQLQYLHHIKCAFAVTFYASVIAVQFLDQHGYLLVASLVLAFICERLGVWKFLFEIKYSILLDRVSKHQGDEDLVVLLGIVGGSHTLKPNGVYNLKGRAQSFWTHKEIEFSFHLKAKSTCLDLSVKRAKELGQQIQIESIIKQEMFAVIQDYMTKKIRAKSKLLPFVMVSQCIKRELLIKALSIHSSIVGEMDLNQRILKKVLKLRISHFSNSKDKMGSIYQLSFGLCCLNKIILTSRIDEVIEHQNLYEGFLKHMLELSLITSRLLTKLISKTIETSKIMTILQQQFVLKSKLDHYTTNQRVTISKQIISLFYIYFAHFCSQKFSVFKTLSMSFIALEQISVKTSKEFMICMVSAAHNNRGSIINANHYMVQFFGMDFQHIKQNLSHIEDILPRPLAVIHNNLIARCLQTGMSTIISSISRFFIVKNNTAFPVQFQVKFQPLIQGINFSCEIRVINSQSFILFDKQNEIVGFSDIARWVLPKKKLQSKYLSQIFGNIRKTQTKLPNASEQSIFSKPDNPFSTHKQMIEQRKYQTNLEFYRTSDFELGICKFTKNSMESTKNLTSQSQVFLHVMEQSNKSQVQTVQSNNQFMILQNKISSMSQSIPIISTFRVIIIVYGILLLLTSIAFFELINISISQSQVMSEYQNTMFHNSPEDIILAIDRISSIYMAGYSNFYPLSSEIQPNVTFSQFLRTQYQKQLDSFVDLKYQLFKRVDSLPSRMVDLLTSKTLRQPTLLGPTLNLPIHSFMTFTIDRKTAISKYTPQQWKNRVMGAPYYQLMNATVVQLEQNVFQSIFSELQSERQYSKNILVLFLACTLLIASLGLVINLVILNRIIKQKQKYMSLLAETDNRFLSSKLKINQQMTSVLNTITKSSMTSLVVSQNAQTVQFKYGVNKSQFNKDSLNICDAKSQINGEKYRSNIRKTLNNKNYKYNQYLVLMVTIFILLPILGNVLVGFFSNFMSTMNSSSYYEEFIKINNKLSKCAGLLLNVNTMLIANNTFPIFNKSIHDVFEESYECIINRETQTKLKDFIPFLSNDKSIETSIEDYIYLSKCDPDDALCHEILSGAVTRGIPSALLSYTTLSTNLYNRMTNFTGTLTGFRLRISRQAIEAFTFYIRQMLQMSDFVLSKIQTILSKNKQQLVFLLYSTLILEILLSLVFLISIYKSRRQIYELKKEVFTILPVDILVDNINFSFQIRNLC